MKNNIKEIRLKKGFTQADMIKKTGISKRYYCSVERSESCPTVIIAKKIAKVLGSTIEKIWSD